MTQMRIDYSVPARELDSVIGVTPQGMHHLIKALELDVEMRSNKKFVLPSGVRKLFTSRGYDYQKQIIAFSVVKGGVGKTSLAHSFSIRASQYGARVLVIDLDQQANLTQAFGLDDENCPTFYEVISGSCSINDAILPLTSNLHLLPSSMNMSYLDRYMQIHQQNIGDVFHDVLKNVTDQYDYIVFDCPPAISSVTAAAALCCTRVVMPVTPMKFSLQGLKASFEEIGALSQKFKKKRPEISIVFNRFDARKTSSTGFLTSIAKDSNYESHILPCFIRENSELENCINQKHSVFDYTKKSNAREDIDLLTREIMGLKSNAFAH